MKATRNPKELDYFRSSRVGYYVIRYRIKDRIFTDRWDNNVKPSYVIESLKHRGASDITITKY